MPASITRALVTSRPKVAGSSRLIPASGPTPGSTPTRVPTKQPMKPYQSTLEVSATENPRARFCSVSSTSEPERSAWQWHLQERVEQVIRAPGHADDEDEPDRQ